MKLNKNILGKYTLNAKAWRKQNGYITPEWMMYVENAQIKILTCGILGLGTGVIVGMVLL